MTDAPKSRSLRDYAHFLRRNLWVIGATVVIAVVVAVALSVSQSKKYSASAQMFFPDPLAHAGIVGEQASNTPPAQLAAQGTSRLTSTSTLSSVKQKLGTSLTTNQIQDAVTSTTDPNTFVVTITATTANPKLAADLANGLAVEVKSEADAAASQQFAGVAKTFRTQIDSLTAAQKVNQVLVGSLYDNYSRALALSRGGAVAAQIQSRAGVPSSPSSPKPVTDGIVGGLLGIVLGLIIAGVRESFDRRLRGPKDVEADLKLPVVGQVREEALGSSPGPSNGRPRLDDHDLEAFRILRTNLEFLTSDRRLSKIAVTSALPEEGKTTVASSLAFTLAVAGRRTLLIECDLRRPRLSERLGLGHAPGLTEYLSGSAKPHEVVREVTLGLGRNGASAGNGGTLSQLDPPGMLACITAGKRTERPAELFGSAGFRQFLDEVAEAYDAVVLDTAPLLPVADTLQLLPSVDAMLVCLRASRTTRDQVIAARTALSRLPERPAGVVLTGSRDPHDYSGYYAYTYSYGDPEEGSGHGRAPGKRGQVRA